VMMVCIQMSVGSGVTLNPMIGLVQSIYMLGVDI
jgi:hypothetical protein